MSVTKPEVVLVSATWCKRCAELKPEIQRLCAATGVSFGVVDYDELEEDDPVKVAVKALPTIRMRTADSGGEWVTYRPTDIEAWKSAVTALPLAVTGDEDF
jgi:thiol-disulfide isomerase/thioredoxin